MDYQDEFLLALTIWRENRGGGYAGMQSVANVIQNRAAKKNSSPYIECTAPEQFSSITAKGDPELNLWPNVNDAQWQTARGLAALAASGVLQDITSGATLYYAPAGIPSAKAVPYELPNGTTVNFPAGWNPSAVTFTGEIANQLFFTE